MATYFRTEEADGEVMRHPTELAKPTPAHAQTKGAKRARRSVRDAAEAQRHTVRRADVEAAYVHPAPEVEAREITLNDLSAQGARILARTGTSFGHRVKATYNRGTTLPKWHVNAPDNKRNPGPPVDASQYHGEVVDCETVYVIADVTEEYAHLTSWSLVTMRRQVRGVWLNGKLDRIEVDGVETTLKAAREVLS